LCRKYHPKAATKAQKYQLKWQLDLRTPPKQAVVLVLVLCGVVVVVDSTTARKESLE